MTSLEILVGLLEAKHAAVYAYGVIGAHLSERNRERALEAFDAHSATRELLVPVLRARGAAVPVAAPAYRVEVQSREQALAAAIRLEDDMAGRWYELMASTGEPGLRRLAVTGLADSAALAARWRTVAGITPATKAFPGQP